MGMEESVYKQIEEYKTQRIAIYGLVTFGLAVVAAITYGVNAEKIHGTARTVTPTVIKTNTETDDAFNTKVLKDIYRVIDDNETSLRGKAYIVASYAEQLRVRSGGLTVPRQHIETCPCVLAEKTVGSQKKEVDTDP